jgi:hypothetical protein
MNTERMPYRGVNYTKIVTNYQMRPTTVVQRWKFNSASPIAEVRIISYY